MSPKFSKLAKGGPELNDDGNGGDLWAESGALAGRNLKWELQLIHHVVVTVVVSVVGVHNYQSLS